jgi:hypothetical protein
VEEHQTFNACTGIEDSQVFAWMERGMCVCLEQSIGHEIKLKLEERSVRGRVRGKGNAKGSITEMRCTHEYEGHEEDESLQV